MLYMSHQTCSQIIIFGRSEQTKNSPLDRYLSVHFEFGSASKMFVRKKNVDKTVASVAQHFCSSSRAKQKWVTRTLSALWNIFFVQIILGSRLGNNQHSSHNLFCS